MDSNCNEPFVTKWYYPAMTKRSKSGIARLWSARCVGRVHGIWTSGGCNCGCFSKCHSCGSVRWKRSWIKKWWGGSPSHPICSMHLRNRWSVVECKIHLHLCVNWIQKDQILEEWGNLHLGRKKFILETASAVVLSDNMEIRMGNTWPREILGGNVYRGNLGQCFKARNILLEIIMDWNLQPNVLVSHVLILLDGPFSCSDGECRCLLICQFAWILPRMNSFSCRFPSFFGLLTFERKQRIPTQSKVQASHKKIQSEVPSPGLACCRHRDILMVTMLFLL